MRPETTDRFVGRLGAAGEHVEHRTDPGGHGTIAELTVPYLLGWSADLVAGRPTDSNCPSG